jgi:hypothetical protein
MLYEWQGVVNTVGIKKRAGLVKCVGIPCPSGELLVFQGFCFTVLAVWFVSYVSQVVDKKILCNPLPRILSKTLYSPVDSESFHGESKKFWESAIDSVLDLSQGFQENNKTPQFDRSIASSGYENESMTTFLFEVSFWYVVARTGLLDGETVAVTLQFMSIHFVGPLGDGGESSLLSRWMWPFVYSEQPSDSTAGRTFLIRDYYIATIVLFFPKIPLLEMVFCFFF